MKLMSGGFKILSMSFIVLYILSLFLYPFLSYIVVIFRKRFSTQFSNFQEYFRPGLENQDLPELDILIPAHNEEKDLGITLLNIQNSLAPFGLKTRIIVGVDLCSDKTELVAQKMGVESVSLSFGSKWRTLRSLVNLGQSEWVALVDVGIEWNALLISEFLKNTHRSELFFIAPSYVHESSSYLNKLNWKLERYLKVIENKSGGPISVHGATVFYRREYLISVLDFLKGKDWLNDDVIIPLTMRALFPQLEGLYLPSVGVKDFSHRPVSAHRRFRILMGNLEILEFVETRRLNLVFELRLLWGRRRARVFWAYFFSAIVFHICLWLPLSFWGQIAFFVFGILALSSKKAFRVSLAAPFYLLKFLWCRWRNVSTPTVKWR